METSAKQLNPYLSFNGQCRQAFEFYAQCLGGRIDAIMSNGESPMASEVPAAWHDRIMHAQLTIGDQVLLGADAFTEHYEAPKGFSVMLQVDDAAEAERAFNALAENGTVTMPLERTFWAERFGMLVDQFGIPWMINCNSAESAQSEAA